MKTFHAVLKAKAGYWLLSIFTIAFMGWMLYVIVDIRDMFIGLGQRHLFFSYTILFLFILTFLILVLSLFRGVAIQKASLTFEENRLILKSIDRFQFLLAFGLKPFEVSYDRIKSVKFTTFAPNIVLESMDGKKFLLVPGIFGDTYGEAVLGELLKRIPMEVFDAELRMKDVVQKISRINNINKIASICFVALILLFSFFDPISDTRSWLNDAWQVKLSHFGYESMWAYSVDTKNNFWAVFWGSNDYRVYHFSETMIGTWSLSKELVAEDYPQFVSSDEAGNPIVWLRYFVYHYDGEGWKKAPYNNGITVDGVNGYAIGKEVWMIEEQDEENKILKINALTGKWSVFPLPQDVVEQGFNPTMIRRSMTGSLLVLMQNDYENRIYVLSSEDWQDQTYTILLPSQESRIKDFFLDSNNVLWVLFTTNNEYFVERISQTEALKVAQMPAPAEGRFRFYYRIFVDSSERVWISTGYPYAIKVFSPVWRGMSLEIIGYTDKNSNYQGDGSVMLSNGQIWSFDQRVSMLDTNSKNLPEPLPKWFADINWSLARLYLVIAQLIFTLFVNFLQRPLSLKKK